MRGYSNLCVGTSTAGLQGASAGPIMRGQGACMTNLAGAAVASAGMSDRHFAARLKRALGDPRRLFLNALELEFSERRLFLWLPVAAGSGAVWYLLADREPS